jgi:hypothetical protein
MRSRSRRPGSRLAGAARRGMGDGRFALGRDVTAPTVPSGSSAASRTAAWPTTTRASLRRTKDQASTSVRSSPRTSWDTPARHVPSASSAATQASMRRPGRRCGDAAPRACQPRGHEPHPRAAVLARWADK